MPIDSDHKRPSARLSLALSLKDYQQWLTVPMSVLRCEAMEEQQQAASEGYAKREGQLQTALERLQLLAQQSQSQGGLARGPPDGRLQAAQARCDRTESRLTSQQVKTQQVMNSASTVFAVSRNC